MIFLCRDLHGLVLVLVFILLYVMLFSVAGYWCWFFMV